MIIKHRVNTVSELLDTPKNYGVEIDLRLGHESLILAHDPFKPGETFEYWLEHYSHKTLILNVKEDGLEEAILKLLQKSSVEDFFFLDQPFPTLRKSANMGIPTALRLSEYESPVMSVNLDIDWLWLDSFFGDWGYLQRHSDWIKTGQFKTCLVSPELQGRTTGNEPKQIVELMDSLELEISAVCTKLPNEWESVFK